MCISTLKKRSRILRKSVSFDRQKSLIKNRLKKWSLLQRLYILHSFLCLWNWIIWIFNNNKTRTSCNASRKCSFDNLTICRWWRFICFDNNKYHWKIHNNNCSYGITISLINRNVCSSWQKTKCSHWKFYRQNWVVT